MKAIAVVVPTHERRGRIEGLLAALAAQTVPPADWEAVLVCDGCTDGTAEIARRLREVPLTVLEQPRSGAATARNRGAAATGAPVLLFLDDDMVPRPECLEAHLAAHARTPGALVLGHMPVHPDSPRSYLTAGLSRWADRRHARLAAPGAVPGFTDVLTGHLSIARASFDAVGGFDPRFTEGGTFGGEDIELGWRLASRGVPLVYAGSAVAEQIYDKTFRALALDILDGARADARLAALHPAAADVLARANAPDSLLARAARGATRAAPRLSSALAAPAIALLDRAARRGRTGRVFESAHAIVRAHLRAKVR
ncbi:MAG TPA: glycosyltransferase [Candidatus Polarisedimenticolaceae bacterium]|nr:glycosyltransferase [Candidatus Polarisedimenticolaceae bacterium]